MTSSFGIVNNIWKGKWPLNSISQHSYRYADHFPIKHRNFSILPLTVFSTKAVRLRRYKREIA